jgi:hypothetical protein
VNKDYRGWGFKENDRFRELCGLWRVLWLTTCIVDKGFPRRAFWEKLQIFYNKYVNQKEAEAKEDIESRENT